MTIPIQRTRVRCPTPHKVAYFSKQDAKAALVSTRMSAAAGREDRAECRFYLCACSRYHLSSKPLTEYEPPDRTGL